MKDDYAYYLNEDVIFIAKDLIGNEIFTKINGKVTAGIITETEAYNGIIDKASHSYDGKRTARNEVMYQKGGIIYVYLCYGIHFLLNILFLILVADILDIVSGGQCSIISYPTPLP